MIEAELLELVRARRAYPCAMVGIGGAREQVLAARAVEARTVRSAGEVGVVELDGVVLPPAYRADLERARRLFAEREAAAARA